MAKKKPLYLWIIFIVVLLLITRFSLSSWKKYQLWESHKSYFELPENERKIEGWMRINFIKRNYGVDFSSATGIDLSFCDQRETLSTICLKQKTDCDEVINVLNENIDKSISKKTHK